MIIDYVIFAIVGPAHDTHKKSPFNSMHAGYIFMLLLFSADLFSK